MHKPGYVRLSMHCAVSQYERLVFQVFYAVKHIFVMTNREVSRHPAKSIVVNHTNF